MDENRYGGHTVSCMTVHLVWVTKYRYKVLEDDVKKRCREKEYLKRHKSSTNDKSDFKLD